MKSASFNITQSGDTVLSSINSHICVARVLGIHCLEDSARRREKSCTAVFVLIHFRLKLDILSFEPVCKLVKGQNGINNALIILSFVLLGNARSDKDCFCIRDSLFDVLAVRLHRRKNVRKIG